MEFWGGRKDGNEFDACYQGTEGDIEKVSIGYTGVGASLLSKALSLCQGLKLKVCSSALALEQPTIRSFHTVDYPRL